MKLSKLEDNEIKKMSQSEIIFNDINNKIKNDENIKKCKNCQIVSEFLNDP